MQHRNCQAIESDICEMLRNQEVLIWLQEDKSSTNLQKRKQAAEEKLQKY